MNIFDYELCMTVPSTYVAMLTELREYFPAAFSFEDLVLEAIEIALDTKKENAK